MNATVFDRVEIDASADRVWSVLTDPDETEKYMFGCRAVTDWKVGSALRWEGVFNGQHLVAVTGAVLECQPQRRLRYTVFDPSGKYRDMPSNYLEVRFEILPRTKGVTLEVTQGDYTKVEDGEKRYQDTLAGWPQVLGKMKALAEGRPLS